MQIARHVLEGRIAQSAGEYERAAQESGTAPQIQESLAYLEPPFWYYPVGQSLGAALLQAGKAKDAAAAFEASLERVPNNGWALWGLMEAQKAAGDQAAAEQTAQMFENAWAGDASLLDLARL